MNKEELMQLKLELEKLRLELEKLKQKQIEKVQTEVCLKLLLVLQSLLQQLKQFKDLREWSLTILPIR